MQNIPLRLVQPNGAERMLVGSEYRIRWAGGDTSRTVSLQYSTDNGRTWKRIADSVRGTEYLWKPIPNEPSDSCLVKVTGMAGDSTVPVQSRMAQFLVQNPYNSAVNNQYHYWYANTLEFSADGTKIMTLTFTDQLLSANTNLGWLQTNFIVRDGRTGSVLYQLPSYRIDTTNLLRSSYFSNWGSWAFGHNNYQWSPNGRRIVAQVNDTTFGIYDADNGALLRQITVPGRGNKTRCVGLQWTAQGQEILATVQHRFFNPNSTVGQGDTLQFFMMRFNATSGALAYTPFMTSRHIFVNGQCNNNFYDLWSAISNDGERRITLSLDSNFCLNNSNSLVVRSTRDNSVLFTLAQSQGFGLQWYGWGWGGYNNQNGLMWSPNDSLVAIPRYTNSGNSTLFVYNTFTGAVVQRFPNTRYWVGYYGQWSPDSKKIFMLDNNNSALYNFSRVIADIATGTLSPIIGNISNQIWSFGWGNLPTGQTKSSTITWSPDGKFVAGFLYQQNRSVFPEDNTLNTVGIWDAETGCLTQTFRLPFPDGITDDKRTFFNTEIQWSADGKRLLLHSPSIRTSRVVLETFPFGRKVEYGVFRQGYYDGTTIIAPVNVGTIPCQEDISDSVFSIIPRGSVRTADVNFPPLFCEQTSASVSNVVANTGLKDLFVRVPTISGDHAADFRLVSLNGMAIASTEAITTLPRQWGTMTLGIEFVPRALGFRFAQLSIIDSSGAELAVIALAGQKDTLAIGAAAGASLSSSGTFTVDFGRVRQYQITSGSVSIRNTGTVPLSLGNQGLYQTPQNPTQNPFGNITQSGQQARVQSNSGGFVIDSLVPAILQPGASGRIHLTFLKNDVEGIARDTAFLLGCGEGQYRLSASATIVPNQPRMEVDSVLSFGHLICEESSLATLRVSNVGGLSLRLISVGITNPDFTLLAPVREVPVEPFTSYSIPIRFTPSAGGATTASIVLNTNDSRQFRVFVRLVGRKTNFQYGWTPRTVDFGNVSFGMMKAQTVLFENQGTAPLTWARLPQRLTDDFVIESVEPNPIPAGASAQVTVRFLGRRDANVINAALEWKLNDACSTPTQLNLAARVLEPQPRIVVADTIRLGTLLCETESRATVVIRNTGDANLLINSVQVEGDHREDFPKDSVVLGATTIRPNESTTLRVYVRPSTLGNRSASILLKTNDTASAPRGDIRVFLAARKDSVSFSLPRVQVNLRTVAEFTPLFDTLLVRNTGTTVLRWQGNFPHQIDTTFVLERIEPIETPVGGDSRVLVRFLGGRAGMQVQRVFRLEGASVLSSSCIRSQELTLRGEILPEPRVSVVQSAPARLLCENATTFTIRLESIGTDDVVLQTPALTVNPNAVFRIVSSPSRLVARTGRDSIVIAASTAQTGMFTAQIRLRSNAANVSDTTLSIMLRKDSSGLQVLPAVLDFGALSANTPTSRAVTLLNTGTIPQGFSLPLRSGAFAVESIPMNPLQANAQTQVQVRFSGGTGGLVRDTLRLMDSCGRVLLLPLQARIVAGSAVLPDTIAIQVGEVADIPVFLRNRNGVETGMEAAFRLSVLNTSLLEILSPSPFASYLLPRRDTVGQVIHFKANIASAQEREPIVLLRMRSLLGNATTTTILLDSLHISGVRQQGSDTALYRSKGINYAGGAARLIHSPNLTLLAIAPNPIRDVMTLRVSALKSAPVLVELTDVIGQKYLLHEGKIDSGEQSLVLPLTRLASGAYWLTVKIGVEYHSQMITILR